MTDKTWDSCMSNAKSLPNGAIVKQMPLSNFPLALKAVETDKPALKGTYGLYPMALIQSDLQYVQGHYPRGSRVKCLVLKDTTSFSTTRNQTGNLLTNSLIP